MDHPEIFDAEQAGSIADQAEQSTNEAEQLTGDAEAASEADITNEGDVNSFAAMLAQLNEPKLHPDAADADLVLRVRCTFGQTYDYKVHKARLAHASEVFAGMCEACGDPCAGSESAGLPILESRSSHPETWTVILSHAYGVSDVILPIDVEDPAFDFAKVHECWCAAYKFQFPMSQLFCDLAIANVLKQYMRASSYPTRDLQLRGIASVRVDDLYRQAKRFSSKIVQAAAWRWLREHGPDYIFSPTSPNTAFMLHERRLDLDGLSAEEQVQLLSSWLLNGYGEHYGRFWLDRALSAPEQPVVDKNSPNTRGLAGYVAKGLWYTLALGCGYLLAKAGPAVTLNKLRIGKVGLLRFQLLGMGVLGAGLATQGPMVWQRVKAYFGRRSRPTETPPRRRERL